MLSGFAIAHSGQRRVPHLVQLYVKETRQNFVKFPVSTFRWDIPVVLYRIIKYEKNIVKHKSINDFIKVYSYNVTCNDIFRI
jgi:hypothetical protein